MITNILKRKQGQVWMETLLYTVVGLAIIGAVLSFALPKLEQNKERAIIAEQISTLKTLDEIVLDLANAPAGNTRIYSVSIDKSALTIDGSKDTISFSIPEIGVEYSEEGVSVKDGRVSVLTISAGKKKYKIDLSTSYDSSGINITTNRQDSIMELTPAPTPYTLQIAREQSSYVNGSGKNVVKSYITIMEQQR